MLAQQRRCWVATALLCAVMAPPLGLGQATPQPYDPLAIAAGVNHEVIDLNVHDSERDRDIPLRVYLPASKSAAPVVLFSHGLGGSRENNPYLGNHWSARGYVVVFMQHAGSDENVWKSLPSAQRLAALTQAANVRSAIARFRDVPVVIDALERWNRSAESPLAGRLDLARIGMSGHSFGAVTTQAVAGQLTPTGIALFTDRRISAALALSPSVPRNVRDPQRAFGAVAIPWMLMTGTKDIAPIGGADLASRLGVYPALPPGHKYELVLEGAEHSAFSDRALPGDREPRNPSHHRSILALSTAFWDAWLRNDASAQSWLDGSGPATVLDPKDHWQHK